VWSTLSPHARRPLTFRGLLSGDHPKPDWGFLNRPHCRPIWTNSLRTVALSRSGHVFVWVGVGLALTRVACRKVACRRLRQRAEALAKPAQNLPCALQVHCSLDKRFPPQFVA